MQHGYSLMYDVSLDINNYYECVAKTKEFISQNFSKDCQIVTTGFGHVGDGNLHMTISVPGYDDEEFSKKAYELVNTFIMEFTRDSKGSVSAEHGIGYMKPKYLSYSKSPEMINAMKLVKNAFDPNGIMNPYKVLPYD